ncbi:hypothetical protein D3C74_323020 [compost metagenome]
MHSNLAQSFSNFQLLYIRVGNSYSTLAAATNKKAPIYSNMIQKGVPVTHSFGKIQIFFDNSVLQSNLLLIHQDVAGNIAQLCLHTVVQVHIQQPIQYNRHFSTCN